jgi:hypothetical protein
MKKANLIIKINNIVEEYGSFSTWDVEADCSPCVQSMGSLVALAETFHKDQADVTIYDPESFSSDGMETYVMSYTDMSKDNLKDILELAKTFKKLEV